VSELDKVDIADWLASLGLGEYLALFVENDIDASVLAELTADDLKDIGVASVGHRRKLLSAIERLARNDDTKATPAPVQADREPDTVAERRTLTVMFCDLADSTALSVGMDPEDFADLIRTFRAEIVAAVQPFDAHIAQYAGDGVLAYFGYPNSSDHDAEKAVEASFAIVERVRRLARFGDRSPSVRIGLATGITVVGGVERSREMRGESAVGETLNLAARLQSLAGPNGIVIAQSTRTLLGDMFVCRDLGSHALKGFADPVRAWLVEARQAAASRFDALRTSAGSQPFVGRMAEMALLREARAGLGQGGARFFRIVGEAGIGKSRLVREALFVEQGLRENSIILQCSPYQLSSPFYPVRYMIERLAGVSSADPEARTLEKLRAFFEQVEECTQERLAVACDLLGIESDAVTGLRGLGPYQRRALTLQHLAAFAASMLRKNPVLILEDIQWMDPSTAELLENVFAQVASQPVLIAATARPGPPPRWLENGSTVSIHLDRLSPEETTALVRRILSDSQPFTETVRAIVERCDGIPIFAEELTRGYAAGVAEGRSEELVSNIPATLAESIMARLDRLTDGRRIASTAAAIGREFPVALLTAVSGLPEKIVQSGIRELLEAGIIMPGYSPFGTAVCFRQMLIRDAAYQLLLRKDRTGLHNVIVRTLRERFPAVAEDMPHIVAMQLFLAGDMAASAQEWLRAGLAATRRSAYGEAVKHLRSGLDATARLPESDARDRAEIALRTTLIGALIPSEGYRSPAVETEMELTLAASVRSGATESLVLGLYSKWIVLGSTGNVGAALELALKMRDIAASGSEVDRLIAWRACGTTLLFSARLHEAIEQYDLFMAHFDEARHGEALRTMHGDIALMVMLGLAEAHALVANGAEAETWRARVLEAVGRPGRAHDSVHLLVYAGCLHPMLAGDMRESAQRAEELLGLVDTHNLTFWRGHALLFSGLGRIDAGDVDGGFQVAEAGIELLLKASAFNNCWYVLMARACIDHGRFDQAAASLEYARPSMDQGDLRFAPIYHWQRARLARARCEDGLFVEAHLNLARQLARAHGSRLFLEQIEAETPSLGARPASPYGT